MEATLWNRPGPGSARGPRQLVFAIAVAAVAGACGAGVPVHTTAAPDHRAGRLRNFAILQPQGAIAAASTGHDFMASNPATFHALSFDLLLAFQARGYYADTAVPDFTVAYYAASHLPVDTTVFNYGYSFPGSYPWWQDEPAATRSPPQADTEGTIIVDVVDPKTKSLLWRGEGVVRLSARPDLYLAALKKAVFAIVDGFSAGGGGSMYTPTPQRGYRRGRG